MNPKHQEHPATYSFGESVETALRFYYQNAHEFHAGTKLPVCEVVARKVHESVFQEDWRQIHHQMRFVEFRHQRNALLHQTTLQLERWTNHGPNGEDGLSENYRFGLGGNWRVVEVGVSTGFDASNNKFFEAYPRFNCGNFDTNELTLLHSVVEKHSEGRSHQEEMRQEFERVNASLTHPILKSCLSIWIMRLWTDASDDTTAVITI